MPENQRTSINVESMRKNFLTLLLKRKDITVVDTHINARMTKEIVCSEHTDCLYNMQLPLLVEADCGISRKDTEPSLINETLKQGLNDLVDLGLSNKNKGKGQIEKENHISLLSTVVYQITPKGLDVALKLQEHDDNERRFEQQKDISTTLRNNSTKSVVTARWALFLSIVLVGIGLVRLHQLEQKILSHTTMETRINALDAEVKELRKKVDTKKIITY